MQYTETVEEYQIVFDIRKSITTINNKYIKK